MEVRGDLVEARAVRAAAAAPGARGPAAMVDDPVDLLDPVDSRQIWKT